MEQTLFRILYCSRNRTAQVEGKGAQALSQIFQTARFNNSRRDVTGALLYSSGFFAQVLEGPREEIEQVFEKIQCDPRHGDVTVLECSDIESRDFPQWSMARVLPVTAVQAQVTGTTLGEAMGNAESGGRNVLELLRSLVIQEDQVNA